jgi:hypothetical protein
LDSTSAEPQSSKTIFHSIPGSPDYTGRVDYLRDEATSLTAAGAETTTWVCVVGCFHVLNQPTIKDFLVDELNSLQVDNILAINIRQLEKLPYLTAIVSECKCAALILTKEFTNQHTSLSSPPSLWYHRTYASH